MKSTRLPFIGLFTLLSLSFVSPALSAQDGGAPSAEEESPFAFRAVCAGSHYDSAGSATGGSAGVAGQYGAAGSATWDQADSSKAAFDPGDVLNRTPDFVVDWDAGIIRPVGRTGWWRGGGNPSTNQPPPQNTPSTAPRPAPPPPSIIPGNIWGFSD